MASSDDNKTSWAKLLVAALGAAAAAGAALGMYKQRTFRSRAIGIIPARYASSRFEGKPLHLILGKPMIQRTWEQAKRAKSLDRIVVATDDERIASCCRKFGAEVVLTSPDCANGTERCQEALKSIKAKFDVVVNIQGDEPLIDPLIIDGVVGALRCAPDAVCSTAVTSIAPQDVPDTNRVKCVVDENGYAIYFSRGMIPHNKKGAVNEDFPYLLHLGIVCFDTNFLGLYARLKPTPLQVEEDLEQLKIIENGHRIKVIKVKHEAHGVDTLADVARVEAVLKTMDGTI